jgi:hypothetical protein
MRIKLCLTVMNVLWISEDKSEEEHTRDLCVIRLEEKVLDPKQHPPVKKG